jgi:hypothetical protein
VPRIEALEARWLLSGDTFNALANSSDNQVAGKRGAIVRDTFASASQVALASFAGQILTIAPAANTAV